MPHAVQATSVEHSQKTFNASATVLPPGGPNKTLGLNADKTLEFGKIAQGTEITKFIRISAAEPVLVEVSANGNISKHMVFDRNHYFSGEKKISLEVESGSPGYYRGQVVMDMYTAENRAGELWLRMKSLI
ncbi:MAG: hypothetical protein ABEJ98_02205 [Candidatus Nanohaloarchaea archaeon]